MRVVSKMIRCLIIIPAYNEAENIEKVVNNLVQNYPQYDYIIVNDGSIDETERICLKNGYQVLNLPINMGIGGAVQTGYCYARDNDYDVAWGSSGGGGGGRPNMAQAGGKNPAGIPDAIAKAKELLAEQVK